MLKTLGAALLVGLTLVGLATASQNERYKFKAKLTRGAEVPKPTGVPAGATGQFAVTTIEPKATLLKLQPLDAPGLTVVTQLVGPTALKLALAASLTV